MSLSVAAPEAQAEEISALLRQWSENPPDRLAEALAERGIGAVELKEYADGPRTGEELESLRKVVLHAAQHGQAEDAHLNATLQESLNPSRRTWQLLNQRLESREPFEATVVEANRGGLVIDVGYGVRGFVPSSHVGLSRTVRLEQYIGRPIKVRVMEIQRGRDTVVLSNRDVLEEERRDQRRELLSQVYVGQEILGAVKRLDNIGAFVDIGGLDGLVHISEVSWKRIDHPNQVLKVGQKIPVKVVRVDAETGKVGLSIKQLATDPFEYARTHYQPGNVYPVTITGLSPAGAQIDLEEGLDGLIPLAELAARKINSPEEVVQVGQTVNAVVLDFRPRESRIIFSLRKLERKQERKAIEDFQKKTARSSEKTTLGDLFGHLFQDFRPSGDEAEAAEPEEETSDTSLDAEGSEPVDEPVDEMEAAAEAGEPAGEEEAQTSDASFDGADAETVDEVEAAAEAGEPAGEDETAARAGEDAAVTSDEDEPEASGEERPA